MHEQITSQNANPNQEERTAISTPPEAPKQDALERFSQRIKELSQNPPDFLNSVNNLFMAVELDSRLEPKEAIQQFFLLANVVDARACYVREYGVTLSRESSIGSNDDAIQIARAQQFLQVDLKNAELEINQLVTKAAEIRQQGLLRNTELRNSSK